MEGEEGEIEVEKWKVKKELGVHLNLTNLT